MALECNPLVSAVTGGSNAVDHSQTEMFEGRLETPHTKPLRGLDFKYRRARIYTTCCCLPCSLTRLAAAIQRLNIRIAASTRQRPTAGVSGLPKFTVQNSFYTRVFQESCNARRSLLGGAPLLAKLDYCVAQGGRNRALTRREL